MPPCPSSPTKGMKCFSTTRKPRRCCSGLRSETLRTPSAAPTVIRTPPPFHKRQHPALFEGFNAFLRKLTLQNARNSLGRGLPSANFAEGRRFFLRVQPYRERLEK